MQYCTDRSASYCNFIHQKSQGIYLIGILATWILGMICQAAGVYRIDADAGFYSLYPTFAMTDFSKIGETLDSVLQQISMESEL